MSSPTSVVGRRLRGLEIAAVFLTVAVAGCGDKAGPTTPSSTTPTTGSVELSFTVYDSAKGRIGAFKRIAPLDGSLARVSLSTPDLGSGIDPDRFALRVAHQGDRLGSLVAATRSGTMDVIASTGVRDFDVFVMNASNGANYRCADTGDADWFPSAAMGGARYGTLRLASAGEAFIDGQKKGHAILDGPEAELIRAVDQVNTVLNPFGLLFGRMDYVGRASAASISAGWTNDIEPRYAGMAFSSLAWIIARPTIAGSPGGDRVWVHELVHVWQKAPDYYTRPDCSSHLDCLLWDCSVGALPLSPKGQDLVRYWTLMSM